MMKKTITLLLVFFNVCFCIKPVLGQGCPSSQTNSTGNSANGETMMGQTISNTCAYSITGLEVSLGSHTSTGTITVSVYSGNTSCSSGNLLKSGTATSGKTGVFTISLSSSQALAANTTYYLELTSTAGVSDVQRLRYLSNVAYNGGQYYYSDGGASCSMAFSSDDMYFVLKGSILPIELVEFYVQNTEGSKNNLTWRTASEKDNSHFDIERSTDGSTFHNIGQVKGNNKPSSYQYVDAAPFTMSYYRLKQVDFDGTTTYSKVVSVEQKGKGKGLKVYPTLVSNGILTVDTEGGQLRDFSVTNLLGQPILVGKTTQQIDVSALAKGTYILKVGTEVAKFVKQ